MVLAPPRRRVLLEAKIADDATAAALIAAMPKGTRCWVGEDHIGMAATDIKAMISEWQTEVRSRQVNGR